MKKQRIYHRAAVSYVWHVDPEARTFEVFRREAERWTLLLEAESEERVRAAPFDESSSISRASGRCSGDRWHHARGEIVTGPS